MATWYYNHYYYYSRLFAKLFGAFECIRVEMEINKDYYNLFAIYFQRRMMTCLVNGMWMMCERKIWGFLAGNSLVTCLNMQNQNAYKQMLSNSGLLLFRIQNCE